MTLNDIIYAALKQLERGTDAQTVDKFRGAFTDYANTGIRRIAQRFKVTYIENVTLDDNRRFDVSSLSRPCQYIESVKKDGIAAAWDEVATGIVEVTSGAEAGDSVSVLYRYTPVALSSATDVPQLPAYTHYLIPYFVVACQRCGSDSDTQATAGAHFDLFNQELANLRSMHLGSAESYQLKNMW